MSPFVKVICENVPLKQLVGYRKSVSIRSKPFLIKNTLSNNMLLLTRELSSIHQDFHRNALAKEPRKEQSLIFFFSGS